MKLVSTNHQTEQPEELCASCAKDNEIEGYFEPDFLDNVGRPLVVSVCKGPSMDSRAPGAKDHQLPCVVLNITSIGTNTPRSQTIHLNKNQWGQVKEMVSKAFEG